MVLRQMVSKIVTDWQAGETSYEETVDRFVQIVTMDSIDELMHIVPLEWRDELITKFRAIVAAAADPRSFRIVGGVFAWEHVEDPSERERMIAEYERDIDAEEHRRKTVVVPAARKWLASNMESDKG